MRRPGFTLLEVLIVLLVLGLALLFSGVSLHGRRDHSNRSRCSNSLRQLGLAALQYADDKRFFPHVTRLTELDGDFVDAGPTTTTKVARALLYYGYFDDPEQFICPSSYDIHRPVVDATARSWFWGGGQSTAPAGASPFVDGLPDPAMAETDELSYGWTRKGLNTNCRSDSILAADRAARDPAEQDMAPTALSPGQWGNHSGAWNVLRSDATVEWVQAGDDMGGGLTPAEVLASTTRGAPSGFLAVRDQSGSQGR